jgi:uncharacterized protein YjbJ (UPF0337 family)
MAVGHPADLISIDQTPREDERTVDLAWLTDSARGRFRMKRSMKDKAEGKVHEVKGAVKANVGAVTRDPDLEAEGKIEKLTGKVQGFVGRLEKAVGK